MGQLDSANPRSQFLFLRSHCLSTKQWLKMIKPVLILTRSSLLPPSKIPFLLLFLPLISSVSTRHICSSSSSSIHWLYAKCKDCFWTCNSISFSAVGSSWWLTNASCFFYLTVYKSGSSYNFLLFFLLFFGISFCVASLLLWISFSHFSVAHCVSSHSAAYLFFTVTEYVSCRFSRFWEQTSRTVVSVVRFAST